MTEEYSNDPENISETKLPLPFLYRADSDLNEEELRGIAYGAALAFRNESILNDVETGMDVWQSRELLKDWWDISDVRALRDAIQSLEAGGQRIFFLAARAISKLPNEHRSAGIKAAFRGKEPDAEAVERLARYASNLAGYFANAEAPLRDELAGLDDITVWDIGRAINLVRWGTDAKFIERPIARQVIATLGRPLRARYSSWEALGKSYLLGRVMWAGYDPDDRADFAAYRALTDSAESP